ncbi:ABC transporter permease [Actinomyces capricornis]|uniref:Riboflavin transport system permease protein RibX n=1 Tax=Actinomyces capricornis TaxID=2755559 RepID=A0ABN6K7V4_9ACTO|nr:ABC transporter permease subunit [Actinomyces capricornis]BDA65588.1 riboflavin transport system permease protein RibX [Actinomyces capricornis]
MSATSTVTGEPPAPGPLGSARRPRRERAEGRRPWPALLLGMLIIASWHLVTICRILPEVFLPGPLPVAERLWLSLTRAGLLGYAWVTIREALLGCLLAAGLALPLAWALHHWPLFSRAVLPYVAASQAVPAIAVAPLLVLWVGYGTTPVVVLCAFMVFFPITATVLLGLRGLDTDIIDAARLDGAHGWSMVLHIELPMTLPAILAGLRTGFTLSITGAVVGEMTMGGTGLGMTLASQRDAVDTTGLFATIVLLCALATTIHWLLYSLERRSRTVRALRGRGAT